MQKSLQSIAAEWHSGQSSALYAYASTQSILPGLPSEIREALAVAKAREHTDLYRLYVNTAPSLTVEDIQAGHEFWHRLVPNADGTPVRCRKAGKLKTWKSRPQDFKLPVKYGLKNSFYITPENIGEWCQAL